LLQCFSIWFFYNFFSKLSLSICFNIEVVKNYNYNKAKSYEESVVAFFTKHCELLQYLSKWFFLWFFQNYLCWFYWRKHCSFPHKTLSFATTFFLMGFFPSKIIFVAFFYVKLVESFVIFKKYSENNHFVQFLSFWSPTQLFFPS